MRPDNIELFPDLEAELVSGLGDILSEISDPVVAGVRIGTKFLDPQLPQPSKQIVLQSDGGNDINYVLREEGFRAVILADDYKTASDLAKWVEAALKQLRFGSNHIHNINIELSATLVDNPTEQEMRLITATALIKAKILTL